MNLIDTHTHIYLKAFEKDVDTVIKESIENGVSKNLLPNISSETTEAMMNLCKRYPNNCYPMIGLHPCDVKEETMEKEFDHIEKMLLKEKFIGIGEIGIDLYWDKTTLDIQKEAFIFQINLAKKYKLPISIHVRESFKESIEIVENLNDENLTGVFHCFTGNIEEARRVIDLKDFYLGVGGVITFKNGGVDKIIKDVDMDYLVLETDAPYLTPTPFRGKRNETKHLLLIAQKLSEIKEIPLKDVAEITTKNAYNIFKL